MDSILEFVFLTGVEGSNMRRLYRWFGISLTTGYKWLERYRALGRTGLEEASRRPIASPR